MSSLRVALLSGALALATAGEAAAVCAGDCDESGLVAVNELVRAVNIALGQANVSTCRAADVNDDDRITIDELLRAVSNSLNDCQGSPVVFNPNPNDPEFMKVTAPTGETAQFNGVKDANGAAMAASSIVMETADGTTRIGFDTEGNLAQATLPGGVTLRFTADAASSDGVLVTATSDGAEDVSVRVSTAGATGAGFSAGLADGGPAGGAAGAASHDFAKVNLKVCGRSNRYAEVDFIVQPPGLPAQVQTYTARREPSTASYVAAIPLETVSAPADVVAGVCYGAETVAKTICENVTNVGVDLVAAICARAPPLCAKTMAVVAQLKVVCKAGVPTDTEVELTCEYLRDVAQRIAPNTYEITPVVRVPYQQPRSLQTKTVRTTDPDPVWDYDLPGQTALMSFFYRQTCTSIANRTYVPGKCSVGYFECVPGSGFPMQYDVARFSGLYPDGYYVQSDQILITRNGTNPGPAYAWEHTDLSWAGAWWDDMLFSWPGGRKLYRHYW